MPCGTHRPLYAQPECRRTRHSPRCGNMTPPPDCLHLLVETAQVFHKMQTKKGEDG
jgi:hypothetical protein